MLSTMSMTDVVQLTSTGLAAIAAAGSATAAGIMYRQWKASATPLLTIDVGDTLPDGSQVVTITNHGAPARKVQYAVLEGGRVWAGTVPPHGFLQPDTAVRLSVELHELFADTEGGRKAVVYGFDLTARKVYAWAANGTSRTWRGRPGIIRSGQGMQPLYAATVLTMFYPDCPEGYELEECSAELLAGGGALPNSS
jgi:hypothetical protein